MSASQLALLGGTPIGAVEADPHPRFTPKAMERVTDLLARGLTVGLNKNCSEIREAEDAIAAWQGVPYCLGTSSGHAALHAALIGLEVSTDDEVITTPYTWGASISCILHSNAVPVFADTCPNTGLIDPVSVEERITPRTRAILAVHIFGQPANMTALRQIADRHNLALIEDGSQAHGAIHQGGKVGTFGHAAGFSCMGGKLLATSEAGYMVTSHEDVYWRAALSSQHMGRQPEGGMPEELTPYVDSLVHTYRLSPINAVLLVEQLSKLDEENAGRIANVRLLRAGLDGMATLTFPKYAEGDQPAYHLLTMNFVPEVAGMSRETYLRALNAEGVRCFSYVPSLINTWPRLQWDGYAGPRVMWTDALRRSGVDYAACELPNAQRKHERGVEMGWNYITVDESKMSKMASAFAKVEENIAALQAWEKKDA